MKIQHLFPLLALSSTLATNVSADSISNSVPLTANIKFFLAREDGRSMPNQFRSDEMIRAEFAANITNNVWYRYLPYQSRFHAVKLFDEKGREVTKTEKGVANSQPPTKPKKVLDMYNKNFAAGWTRSDLWVDYVSFRPDEIFVIPKKGIYELEIRAQIYVPMTNGMPDTNAMLDSKKTVFAKNYGLIESPPLHIKVIKE